MINKDNNPFDSIIVTIDVEWAHDLLVQDILELLSARGIKATFFCTHAGLKIPPPHEVALHPNFRRMGTIAQELLAKTPDLSDTDFYDAIMQHNNAMYPAANGVRAHCLFYDSEILKTYKKYRIAYDSSYFLPRVSNIVPFMKEHNILEIPLFYMDHIHLVENTGGFRVQNFALRGAGLKVFDFHPNMVYINANSEAHYIQSKPFYHAPDKLLPLRNKGEGVRTLFVELLDYIHEHQNASYTLGELNSHWRQRS